MPKKKNNLQMKPKQKFPKILSKQRAKVLLIQKLVKLSNQQKKEGKPPIEPPINETIIPENGEIGITHGQTAELRKEKGFDAYEKEPKKFAEWDAEADKRIADNKMPELIKRMERGDEIDAVEQRMMGKYIATLNAEVSKNPTKENIANLKKAVELSDIVGEANRAIISCT